MGGMGGMPGMGGGPGGAGGMDMAAMQQMMAQMGGGAGGAGGAELSTTAGLTLLQFAIACSVEADNEPALSAAAAPSSSTVALADAMCMTQWIHQRIRHVCTLPGRGLGLPGRPAQ
mmetsp:Transcript_57701/g.159031  ORF Transcript_57701/g.159031 Transcript_57701/m.159031 type:complete len:116 (-) Transcript_57701:690-1037(-)